MKALKWGKFYWSDWESDHNLKLCSLAAQGLWMRCLCICAKADAPGYLILGGKALDTKSVAKVSGVSIKIATKLLAELEDKNVFSRNKDGVVYSRRMVRDGRKSGPGSLNIHSIDMGRELLNPEDEIVVYCSNPACPASRAAYQILTGNEYKHVRRFASGLEDWEAHGYPLEGAGVAGG